MGYFDYKVPGGSYNNALNTGLSDELLSQMRRPASNGSSNLQTEYYDWSKECKVCGGALQECYKGDPLKAICTRCHSKATCDDLDTHYIVDVKCAKCNYPLSRPADLSGVDIFGRTRSGFPVSGRVKCRHCDTCNDFQIDSEHGVKIAKSKDYLKRALLGIGAGVAAVGTLYAIGSKDNKS